MLDGIEAYGAQLQRLLYGRMQIGQIEAFQKTQHLHIGAPTQLAHPRFHQATQCGERLGKFPALERGCLIERIDLVLDQRQVTANGCCRSSLWRTKGATPPPARLSCRWAWRSIRVWRCQSTRASRWHRSAFRPACLSDVLSLWRLTRTR